MATHEQQQKLGVEKIVSRACRLDWFLADRRRAFPLGASTFSAYSIDHAAAGNGQQPRAWFVRQTRSRPLLPRVEARFLIGVLGQIQIPVLTHESAEDGARFSSKHRLGECYID